jgi:hypothetical protein
LTSEDEKKVIKVKRKDVCKSQVESCVLGIEKKNLSIIKKVLLENNSSEEYFKIEAILKGNYIAKKNWK